MKNSLYKVLIAEDEEIERTALQDIIEKHYQNTITVFTAKNGKEAIDIFCSEYPDLVLIDINMPFFNGLEAIEEMKKRKADSLFLILTSYDYFTYAKEAIRLGVEDFLLKPIKTDMIINAISSSLAKSKVSQNNRNSVSAIVKKYAEVRPVLEQECLFAILSGKGEVLIQQQLRGLNIRVEAVMCFVVDAPVAEGKLMRSLKQHLYDFGYYCLFGYIHQKFVFFLLHNNNLVTQDVEIIQSILSHYHMKKWKIGIGTIETKFEKFHLSYIKAMNSIRTYDKTEPLLLLDNQINETSMYFDLSAYKTKLLDTFLRQDESERSKITIRSDSTDKTTYSDRS